jgi:hypothetical protein
MDKQANILTTEALDQRLDCHGGPAGTVLVHLLLIVLVFLRDRSAEQHRVIRVLQALPAQVFDGLY